MRDFVLVHGALHGAWCWQRMIPYLADGAGTTLAIDLPGHGARIDAQPLEEIAIDDFADAVVADIEAADLQDVVLVGHSLGGVTISRVAGRIPGRIRRLIYLAAVCPRPGESVSDVMKHPLSPVSQRTPIETMFCNDLDAETSAWLLGNLGSEPPGPMSEVIPAVDLELPEPPLYIVCERDAALHPDIQRQQAKNAGAKEISFDSGHSAFASKPGALAELLIRLA